MGSFFSSSEKWECAFSSGARPDKTDRNLGKLEQDVKSHSTCKQTNGQTNTETSSRTRLPRDHRAASRSHRGERRDKERAERAPPANSTSVSLTCGSHCTLALAIESHRRRLVCALVDKWARGYRSRGEWGHSAAGVDARSLSSGGGPMARVWRALAGIRAPRLEMIM